MIQRCTVFLAAVLIAGCTSQSVALIHPQSGARAKCDASAFGYMTVVVDTTIEECVKRIEKEGYVPVPKLTPDERADLERRGLLPQR